jgi:hypothetical protein
MNFVFLTRENGIQEATVIVMGTFLVNLIVRSMSIGGYFQVDSSNTVWLRAQLGDLRRFALAGTWRVKFRGL